jgi:hypothetical protein
MSVSCLTEKSEKSSTPHDLTFNSKLTATEGTIQHGCGLILLKGTVVFTSAHQQTENFLEQMDRRRIEKTYIVIFDSADLRASKCYTPNETWTRLPAWYGAKVSPRIFDSHVFTHSRLSICSR